MKIIKVDNYDREGPGHDPVLIAESVRENYAKIICDYLNALRDPMGDDYYVIKPDDYVLTKWEP